MPVGPLHRPNQPCVLCHREGGLAEPYSVAGTVYFEKGSDKAAAGAEVVLLDDKGRKHTARTNCAGNFFVRPGSFTPHYPLWATLRVGDFTRDMESAIFREASCAGCHSTPAAPHSAGPVFVTDDPAGDNVQPPTARCP